MSLLEETGSAMPDAGVPDGAGAAPPVARLAPTHVVAAGVAGFADDLVAQGVAVTRVDWRPPPVGTEGDLADVALDRRRGEANALAVRQMLAAGAELVDVRPAREVLGLAPGQFLHAGPPIGWGRASGPLRGALIGAALFEGLVETPEEAEAWFAKATEGSEGSEAAEAEAGASGRGGGEDGSRGGTHGHGGEGGGNRASGDAARATAPELAPCHHRGGVGPMAGVVSEVDAAIHELGLPAGGHPAAGEERGQVATAGS